LFKRHSEQVKKSAPERIAMPIQEREGEHNGIEQSERWTRELPENFDNPGHLTCPIEARVKSDGDDDPQMSYLSRADWKVRCVSPTTIDRLLVEEISLSSDCGQIRRLFSSEMIVVAIDHKGYYMCTASG
jgi:hypothetical protein